MTGSPTVVEVDTVGRLRAVIGRLSRRLRTTPAAAAAGLTPTGISMLLSVVRCGPIRLSELARSESINPTMLSRVISDLAETGLLERVSDEDDRRTAWVRATAAGRRLAERMRRERTGSLSLALSELSEADRRAIESVLPALEQLAEQLRANQR